MGCAWHVLRWCGWFGLLWRLPCKAPGWCYHTTNHKRMTGHPLSLLSQWFSLHEAGSAPQNKHRVWTCCSNKSVGCSAPVWVSSGDRELSVVHGFCTVHRPECEDKREKIMGSFLLLGSKYLHQLSHSWPVDGCTWDHCSENSSQSRGENAHFLEKCSFRCRFFDQINLLNRFFLFLISVWVNAASTWHISFREKSDSGLMNMFLSSTSKLRPIHQPGKCCDMSWFTQAAQVSCFLPLALSLSLNCHQILLSALVFPVASQTRFPFSAVFLY